LTSEHPEEIWNIHLMQFLGDTGLSSISQSENARSYGWSVREEKEGVLDMFKREWEQDYEEW
jgi:hypothetical protein